MSACIADLSKLEQEMAFSQENQKWIKTEITKALGPPAPMSRSKKMLNAIKDWGLATTLVSIPLALLALVITLGLRVNTDVRDEATFRARTDIRLTEMETALRTIQASQAPKKVLRQIEHLDPSQFAKNLEALRTVAQQPVSAVQPSRAAITHISAKLRETSERVPGYWPATLQFINFASASLVPDVPLPDANPDLVLTRNIGLMNGPVIHEFVVLDGARIANVVFDHCRIRFTERPLFVRNILFVNCVFEFPYEQAPNDSLKRVSQEILAAGLSSVQVDTAS